MICIHFVALALRSEEWTPLSFFAPIWRIWMKYNSTYKGLKVLHYTNFWPYYWSWPYKRIWLFTLLREVSIEHLQRVRHANRGRLLLRTPGPIPYGICKCSFVETTETESYITPVYDTFPWLAVLPNLTLLLNIGFHRTSATGVACRQGTLTPPDTWSCHTLGKCSNVETNISWTCLVSGLLSFEHPSVLLFLLHPYQVSSKFTKQFLRRSWTFKKFPLDGRRRRTDVRQTTLMTIAHIRLRLIYGAIQCVIPWLIDPYLEKSII